MRGSLFFLNLFVLFHYMQHVCLSLCFLLYVLVTTLGAVLVLFSPLSSFEFSKLSFRKTQWPERLF